MPDQNATWFDYLRAIAPKFEHASRVAWQEVVDDVMPLEITLDQMPRQFLLEEATYNVEYRPIGEPPSMFQVCVTDVSDRVRSERADEDRREVMAMFERVLSDRSGIEAFVADGTRIVEAVHDAET